MGKQYYHLWADEGAEWKDLNFVLGTLFFHRKFILSDLYFNFGYTLGWIIEKKYLEPFFSNKAKNGIDTKAFFKSLRYKSSAREHDYIHYKIRGFCDTRAPIRNSGILKKWYKKWAKSH